MTQKKAKERTLVKVGTRNFNLSPVEVNLYENMLYHSQPIESFSVIVDYRIDYEVIERFHDDPDPQGATKGHRMSGYIEKTATVTWYHPHEVFKISCYIPAFGEDGVISHDHRFTAFYKEGIFARLKINPNSITLHTIELDCFEATISDVIYEVKDWIKTELII